jgi:hypothetical protein
VDHEARARAAAGDILIERDNFTFYAPIVTGILISLVLSFVLWLLSR